MKNVCILILFYLLVVSCKEEVKTNQDYDTSIEVRDPEPIKKENKQKIRTTAGAIAFANGLSHWDKVKQISFTFNVDQDSTHYERTWSWRPKSEMITMMSSEDTITYNRKNIDSISIQADKGFINDKYWLLAPFNLVWDETSFTSKHQIKAVAPISKNEMQKLTIVYNNSGGYTPGDAYDFYFNGDFKIKEWVFRKANTKEPSLITSWEDYENFDGITIAKTHHKEEGNWKLYFTNIKIETD
ncbi:hypothetical protein GCM10022393_04330 [Aquimarina addita]|uniref:DUF3047 domain-containing protein n=1 Tax=Aquimarina addita TaxID=870485 RepID=A0ABP7XA62_9FLAO